MRDDVDAEAVALDLVDRQRHAVDGDRTLGGDVFRQAGRDREGQADRFAVGPDRREFADAVDMAGDDVAAQLVADFQRPFQVDPRSGVPGAESRLRQGLARGLDHEPARPLLDHRQADAAMGNGGADRNRLRIEGGLDGEAGVALPFHGPHAPDVGDDSGKHARNLAGFAPGGSADGRPRTRTDPDELSSRHRLNPLRPTNLIVVEILEFPTDFHIPQAAPHHSPINNIGLYVVRIG